MTSPSPVIAALRAYAADPAPEEERSIHPPMRALMEHDDYFVPLDYFPMLGAKECSNVLTLSRTATRPARKLWVFTSEERVHAAATGMRAAGFEPGAWGGPFPGTVVFARIPPGTTVVVNPFAELETSWSIDGDALPYAWHWASAVDLEQRLPTNAPGLPLAIVEYRGYQLLVQPNDSITTAIDYNERYRRPALLFTSPDSTERALERFPGLRPIMLDARSTFSAIRCSGVDGIVVNVFGPGPIVTLGLGVCDFVLDEAPAVLGRRTTT